MTVNLSSGVAIPAGPDSGPGASPGAATGLAGYLARSRVLRIVGARLLQAIPVLLGISFITFGMMNLLPGDAALALLGSDASPAQVRQLNIQLHLNEPFLTRYGHWVGGVLTGNFGTSSSSGGSVGAIILQRLPVTAELGILALIVSIVTAVPVAVLAARRPGGPADRVSMAISMAGFAIPGFVLALLLILVFSVKLNLLPAIGFVPLSESIGGNLRSVALPVIALGFGGFCGYTRFLRADIVDQSLSQDYILTARAKGAGPWRVLVRHALRNSLLGFMTLLGLNLAGVVGGTVVLEQIFALPGIGQGLLLAINDRDVDLVEGLVLVFAAAVVLANLITDLLYVVVDPRIRYGSTTG